MGASAAELTLQPTAQRSETPAELGEAEHEYRTLMRKWWFGAAVGVPTMVLSYPWLFPGLRDWFPRETVQIRVLWAVIGLAALAVLAYSGSQFFAGAW